MNDLFDHAGQPVDSVVGGWDSGCGGGGDSCGGGAHNPGMSCPPSFYCCGCGERYAERCKCDGRYQPCPTCGLHVYWQDGKPNFHACGQPKTPRPHVLLAEFADFLANMEARAFQRGVESANQSARGGSAHQSKD